jgi:nitroimidazol reductase NimA-like FMN-containing flavoprotein (pyridoxamine 5'-phosphate oxidase superfamily)
MAEDLRPAELHELDRAACFVLLASQHVGRLVVAGDEPFVAPLNYVVVDETLIFRSDDGSPGGRVRGPVVFEADVIDDHERAGWSVVARGTVDDVTDDADLVVRTDLRPWAPGPKDRWLRITIEHVTGRYLRGEEQPWPLDGRGYL